MALFIEPETVPGGPFTVHGDSRSFDSNSAPAASRGYIWINVDTGDYEWTMNPSIYLNVHEVYDRSLTYYPTAQIRLADQVYPPSEKNIWQVERRDSGELVVSYDLVISGYLEGPGAHINGSITFLPQDEGGYAATFWRDGFPWAEAYFHDGQGGIETIFQDPAIRGNPHDLFAYEPDPGWGQRFANWLGGLRFGRGQPSSGDQYFVPSQ